MTKPKSATRSARFLLPSFNTHLPSSMRRRLSKIRDGWYAQQVRSALALALALDRDDKTLRSFETTFHKPNSLRRRIELGRWVLKDGRRKRADRVALFGFVIAGWI